MAAPTEPKVYPAPKGNPSHLKIMNTKMTLAQAQEIHAKIVAQGGA